MIHEAVRDMIGIMVADVLARRDDVGNKYGPQRPDDVRHLPEADFAIFARNSVKKERPLRHFLMTRMYRHFWSRSV